MTNTIRNLIIMTALIWTGAATAHEGKGPHGGRLADAGSHHVELVMTSETVEVFVSTRSNAPIEATNLSGLAIVVANGASTRIPLAGLDTNRLTGKAPTALPNGARSVVRVKLADGQTIQASFD